MREIKFRAWDKYGRKMTYEDERHWFNGAYMGDNGFIQDCTLTTLLNNPNIEIMQYTGLKDKNGKEIWEGDIVEYEDEVNGVWAEYFGIPIIYSNEYAMFCFKDDEGNLLNIYRNLKVIGNIYEDKELLGGDSIEQHR